MPRRVLRAIAHLLEEHRAAERVLESIEGSLEPFDPVHLRRSLHFFKYVMDRVHHAKEEDVLFSILIEETDEVDQRMLAQFQEHHTNGHAYLKAAEALLLEAEADPSFARDALAKTIESYANRYKIHMKQEERLLFPLAEEVLSRSMDSELLERFHTLQALLIHPQDYEMYLELANAPTRSRTRVMRAPIDRVPTVVESSYLLFDDGRHQNRLSAAQFLIVDGDEALILDPIGGPTPLGGARAQYLFFSQAQALVPLERWLMDTDADVLVPSLVGQPLPGRSLDSLLDDRLKMIPDEGGLIALGMMDLAVLPAHFLGSPTGLQIFDPISKTLFSGSVGASTPSAHRCVERFDLHVPAMEAIFRRTMSNRATVRAWVAMVRRLDVHAIAPRAGAVFLGEEMVARFLEWCESTECGTDLAATPFALPTRRCVD